MNRIFKSDSRVRVALVLLAVMVGLVGIAGFWGHGVMAKASKSAAVVSSAATKADVQKAKDHYATLPLVFEANKGQTDSRVKFLARSSGYTAFLTDNSAVLRMQSSPKAKQLDVVSIDMVGANSAHTAEGVRRIGVSHYYIGNDRSKWIENVPGYADVRYGNIYPGIDVHYQANQRKLRYDFVVNPGADPKAIRLAFTGAKNVTLDKDGNLNVALAHGEMVSSKPYIYQEAAGVKKEVAGNYHVDRNQQVTFDVASYDTNQALVIDPSASYATYDGGTQTDGVNGTAMDASGVTVVGSTLSPNFPVANAAQGTIGAIGSSDAFVTKFNILLTGSQIFSTYFGGNAADFGLGITVSGGKSYFVGQTFSSNFPTSAGAFQGPSATAGNGHGFVASLSSTGTMNWSTELGGTTGSDTVHAVVVDGAGNVDVTGQTGSTDFPLKSAVQSSISGISDAFYTSLKSDGTALVFSTLFGGTGDDAGLAIAVDSKNNAYITGRTTSGVSGFFAAGGLNTNQHGFVAKFTNKASNAGGFGTLLGSNASASESGNAIALDVFGNIYVGGQTSAFPFTAPSTTNPATNQVGTVGLNEGFVAQLTPGGGTINFLVASTSNETTGLAPGGGTSTVTGLTLDGNAQIYLGGTITNGTFAGTNDILFRRLNLPGAGGILSIAYLANYPVQPGAPGAVGTIGDVITQATGVSSGTSIGFDPSTRTACVGGQANQDGNLTALTNFGAGVQQNSGGGLDGFVVCRQFTNDTVASPNSISLTVAEASPVANLPTATIAITNQGVVNPPYAIGAIVYNPVLGAPFAADPWLTATANGNTIKLTLAAFVTALDPGIYGATVPITVGGTADNAGAIIMVPVTLNVTGNFLINMTTNGGIPVGTLTFAKTNAGDTKFTDGNGTENLFIPVTDDGVIAFAATSNEIKFSLTTGGGDTFVATLDATAPGLAAAIPSAAACGVAAAAGTATPGVCYVKVSFAAAQFNAFVPGTYTATANFAAVGPGQEGAPVTSAQVPGVTITFTVTIGNPGTLQVSPATFPVRFDFPSGGTFSEISPDFTINPNSATGNATITLPAGNPAFPAIPIPPGSVPSSLGLPVAPGTVDFQIQVISPSALANGIYLSNVLVNPTTGKGNGGVLSGAGGTKVDTIPLFIGPSIVDQIAANGTTGIQATGTAHLAPTGVGAITVTAGGTGFTSNPAVTISGGGGSGATATAAISGGVASVTMTAGGAGFNSAPAVTFTGGGGAGATGTANLNPTGVSSTTITNGGSGYNATPTVTFTGGGGTGATGIANLTGSVFTVTVGAAGAGYTSVPAVTFTGGGGTGAAGTATLQPTGVGSLVLDASGSGFTSAPGVTISGGGGTGATGHATLNPTTVASIVVDTGGAGYNESPTSANGGITFGAGCTVNPVANGNLGPTGNVTSVTITNPGSGCTFPALTVTFVSPFDAGAGTATTVATGHAVLAATSVGSIVLDTAGTGYTSVPTVAIAGGGGTGAAGHALLAPTGVASVTVTAGGTGYTSAPTVGFTGGGGAGAAATANMASSVLSISITSPGTGYTSDPAITIGAPQLAGGTTATATAAISTSVASVTVNTAGAGYTSAPTVVFDNTGTGGTGESATANLSGTVTSITTTAAGTGYTTIPTVTITGGGGTGATATALLAPTSVQSVTVNTGGSGYTAAPAVSFTGGGGTGATATATIGGGVVTAVNVTAGGSGFTSVPGVTIAAPGVVASTALPIGDPNWPSTSTTINVSAGVQVTDVFVQPNGEGLLAATTGTGHEINTANTLVGGGPGGVATTSTISGPTWVVFNANSSQTIGGAGCTLQGNALETSCGGINGTLDIAIFPPTGTAAGTYPVTVTTTANDPGTGAPYFTVPATINVVVSNGLSLIVTAKTPNIVVTPTSTPTNGGTTFTTVQGSGQVFGNLNNTTTANAGQNYTVAFSTSGGNINLQDVVTATFTSNDGNAWVTPLWGNSSATPAQSPQFNPNCVGNAASNACTLVNTNVNGAQGLTLAPNQAVISLLTNGTYNGKVTLNSSTNPPQPVIIPVQLIVSNLPTVISTPASIAPFNYLIGGAATSPASQTTQLSLTCPGLTNPTGCIQSGATYNFTATPSISTGPANWLQIALNGGAASTGAINGILTSSGAANVLAVSVNPAALPLMTTATALSGTITIQTSSAQTANSTFTIPVTINVQQPPQIGFSPATGTSNFTVGQAAASPASFTPQFQVNGTSDTFTFTSSAPTWLTVSPTTATGPTPVTVSINSANLPTGVPSATATITAKGVNGPETATFTVTVNIATTPVLNIQNSGSQSNQNIAYNAGDPDPAPVTLTVSVTSTPQNPSIPITVATDQPWCTANPTSTTVNNTPVNITITFTPLEQHITANSTCHVTVTAATGQAQHVNANPAVFTFSLIVGAQVITSATPSTLTFNEPTQMTAAASQNVTLGGVGTFSFTVTPTTTTPLPPNSAHWLTAPATGNLTNGAGTLPVSVNSSTGSLAPGTYTGTVAFQGPAPTPFNLPVVINVGAITATPSSAIAFNHTLQFTTPTPQTVALASNGVPLPFTVSVTQDANGTNPASCGTWLTASASNGNVTPSTVTVSYNTPTVVENCSGSVTITTTNSSATPITIPVTLNSTIQPTLSANLSSVTLTGVVGQSATPTANFTIIGNGLPAGATMPFTVTFSSAPAFLNVTPTTGQVGSAGTAISTTASLAAVPGAGTYDGSITITSPNASNTLTIPAVFILSNPTITPSQTTVNFAATTATPATTVPPPVTISFTSNGGPATFLTSVTATNPGWLTATPLSGSTTGTVTISANATGLAPGLYTGVVQLTLTGANNPTIVIPVTLTVTQVTCTFTLSAASPIALTYTGTATPSSTAPGGVFPSVPVSVTATAGANCGTTFTVTSNHPEWLMVAPNATGFTYNAFSNPHSSARNGGLITFMATNLPAGVVTTPLTLNVTETASPLTLTQRQIVALYQQIFNREPDQGGFNFWSGQGAAGLGQMADSFFLSPEAMSTDFLVLEEYQAALGRFPTFAEYTAALGSIRGGTQSPSGLFTQLLGTSTNSTVITTSIYLNLLGRAPSATELSAGSALTPFQLFTNLIGGAEFKNQSTPQTADHSNFLYIRMLYFIILQREVDSAGFNFWLGVANGGGPGVYFNSPATRITILGTGQPGEGFIGSPEFQGLFQ